jgi:UDP-N-acetylglucosamine transferase subunit ALG13
VTTYAFRPSVQADMAAADLVISHAGRHSHLLSLSHTHTLSLSLSLSHTHTHTHTLSLSLPRGRSHRYVCAWGIGSGSIMEALRLHRPLVVVVNALLMDNHQAELAQALAAGGFLVHCTPTYVAPHG